MSKTPSGHSDTQAPHPMHAIASITGTSSTWMALTGQIASQAFHLVHFIPSETYAFTGSMRILPVPRNSMAWAAVPRPSITLSLTSFGPRETPAANMPLLWLGGGAGCGCFSHRDGGGRG